MSRVVVAPHARPPPPPSRTPPAAPQRLTVRTRGRLPPSGRWRLPTRKKGARGGHPTATAPTVLRHAQPTIRRPDARPSADPTASPGRAEGPPHPDRGGERGAEGGGRPAHGISHLERRADQRRPTRPPHVRPQPPAGTPARPCRPPPPPPVAGGTGVHQLTPLRPRLATSQKNTSPLYLYVARSPARGVDPAGSAAIPVDEQGHHHQELVARWLVQQHVSIFIRQCATCPLHGKLEALFQHITEQERCAQL